MKRTIPFIGALFCICAFSFVAHAGQFYQGKRTFTILDENEKTDILKKLEAPVAAPTTPAPSPNISSSTAVMSLSSAPVAASGLAVSATVAMIVPVAVSSSTPASPSAQSSSATIPSGIAALPANAPDIAGAEFLSYVENTKFFKYSSQRWLKMRRNKEGYDTGTAASTLVETSTGAAKVRPAPEPLPPGLSVELPYESQLSISGRKVIGVSYKSTLYDREETGKRINSGSFDMNQELQVRIKGRVGRKINVNVDFDDTKDDKRDISVVYKGDPDEIVQEAAFGDIAMSIPSTEFVGYSRQLFGVKLDTKYRGLRTQGFFSRTKGLSEIKRFSGNTEFVPKTIPATQYIDKKYYTLRFNSDVIINGTVNIFVDDQNPNNNQPGITTSTSMPVELIGAAAPNNLRSGDFDLWVAGRDYTVDYERGILIFRNKLPANYVVAIDYQRQDKTWLHDTGSYHVPKVIKDINNTAGITTELKTFYSLGNVKIIRDNGRGNFILRIIDANKGQPATIDKGNGTTIVTPQYPQNMTVDFEAGVFNFEPPDQRPFGDDVYVQGKNPYSFYSEYRYRKKIFTLRAGIVPQSERVVVDGKNQTRDEDYFIDYDAGLLTFFNEEKITEGTVIEVSYEYAPFGSSGGSTLVGVRSELSLTKNIIVGSSFIYDFAAKTQNIPDIRTTPTSLMVWEGDAKISDIEIPFTPLTLSLGGEYARSERNPNIMDKAIIESMEGIKQEDTAAINWEKWQLALNQNGEVTSVQMVPPRSDGKNPIVGDIAWNNDSVESKQINPNLQISNEKETQQVLTVNYSLSHSTEVSIVQALSNIGIDYSKKIYLEGWINTDGNGEDIIVGYGSFNEDVDNSGIMATEDTNGDGTLNQGEDIGWGYHNPASSGYPATVRIGEGNGKVDSKDLDANGVLTRFDTIAGPGPYHISVGTTTGWHFVQIPLNITSAVDWQAIKQVRLTINGHKGTFGSIQIANLTLSSNKWEPVVSSIAGSSVTIAAINNETDPNYARSDNCLIYDNDYQSLYDLQSGDITNRKEQTLLLKYKVTAALGGEAGAKVLYDKRAYDFSSYRKFRVFVHGTADNAGDTFFIQAGNDSNYFEFSKPIKTSGWDLVTIHQVDVNKDGKPDLWCVDANGERFDPVSLSSTSIKGTPSLANIAQIKLGVRTTGIKTADLWVNEIHVTESFVKTGEAWRANADLNWPGWMSIGAKRKTLNRNFETFSAGVYNRDSLEDSAYANVSALSWLPINTSISRSRTVTPSVFQNQNDLVSILDEGRVVNYTGNASANLNLSGYWPKFSGTYSRGLTDTQQLQRLEDKETMSGTMNFDNPVRFLLFPTNISANYSISNSFYRLYPSTRIIDSDTFIDPDAINTYLEIEDYHTLEVTETWGGRAPFQFGSLLTINPSYNLTTVREENNDIDRRYPKSLSQDVSANSTLKLFSWFAPNFSYSISTKENYNLSYSTYSVSGATVTPTYPSQKKYIERSGTGEVSWNFQVRELADFRLFQSLGFSSSYRIQDSDSYDNVAGTFTALGTDKLWIRDNPLMPVLAPGTTGSYIIKSLVKKDDVRVSGKYNPFEPFMFEGRLAPIRTFSSNFTFTKSQEDSNNLGNRKIVFTTVWPDLLFGINQFEKFFWIDRWISEWQLNVKQQLKTVDTVDVSHGRAVTVGGDTRLNVFKKVDMSFSYTTSSNEDRELTNGLVTGQGDNLSWSGQGAFNLGVWRFTLRYDNIVNVARDGTGKLTTDVKDDTYTTTIYSDMSFPGGVPIPFTRKTLPLTNRLIFNTSLKYGLKSSSMNVDRDNTTNYDVSTSGEYEVSQNFRLSLGVGWQRMENRVKSDENYTTIQGKSQLTIQF